MDNEQQKALKKANKEQPRDEKRAMEKDTVFVGKKPTMSYVLAVMTQFSDGLKEIKIKARGRSISTAVDVAEVVRNRFVQGTKAKVEIGTDEIEDDHKHKIKVSTICITLNKE